MLQLAYRGPTPIPPRSHRSPPARFAELIQRLPDQSHLFRVHKPFIRTGDGGGWIQGQAAVRIFGLQGNRGLAAAAFGGVPAFAIIPGFVGRDPEQPGLKLAPAAERIEIPDHGQERFLADFLGIFRREIGRELKDEAPGGGVMQVEQFVPRIRFAPAAPRQQFGFRAHAILTLPEADLFEQDSLAITTAHHERGPGPDFGPGQRGGTSQRLRSTTARKTR
jgi:hypothetical protein